MITPADVVAEARSWVGTPYHHQARVKNVGVDCAGLVIGVARELGMFDVEYQDYGRIPYQGLLPAICDRHLVRCESLQPACVLVMSFLLQPGSEQHLAILTDTGTIVHAYESAGACVEHQYSVSWQRRTRIIYRYPGVA
jgi:NlpC/P60 family putative phage cell wall peptidase